MNSWWLLLLLRIESEFRRDTWQSVDKDCMYLYGPYVSRCSSQCENESGKCYCSFSCCCHVKKSYWWVFVQRRTARSNAKFFLLLSCWPSKIPCFCSANSHVLSCFLSLGTDQYAITISTSLISLLFLHGETLYFEQARFHFCACIKILQFGCSLLSLCRISNSMAWVWRIIDPDTNVDDDGRDLLVGQSDLEGWVFLFCRLWMCIPYVVKLDDLYLQLLNLLWNFDEMHGEYKKRGWRQADFVVKTSRCAYILTLQFPQR